MKVFVTGAGGFVGHWLQRELVSAGHEVIASPNAASLDIGDVGQLVGWLSGVGGPPDGVVHLAGMAFAPDAAADPAEAFRVNVSGTSALFEALRETGASPAVLVAGSADVYGRPRPIDLPLRESAPLRPRNLYGLSKLAQEGIALAYGHAQRQSVIVARSFNHTGPGQRPEFVVPAMARRVLAVRDGAASTIPAGNVDVLRDILDVRDVVRAYRLLLERAAAGAVGNPPISVNVASGQSLSIRWVIEYLSQLAGIEPTIEIARDLVRADDPPEMRGSADWLSRLTSWQPEVPIQQTLRDVYESVAT